MTNAPEQQRLYTQFVDASNYERLAFGGVSAEGAHQIRIKQAGVCVGGLAADGVASFDWPGLQALAESPRNDMGSVIARLLIAARDAGRKESHEIRHQH